MLTWQKAKHLEFHFPDVCFHLQRKDFCTGCADYEDENIPFEEDYELDFQILSLLKYCRRFPSFREYNKSQI